LLRLGEETGLGANGEQHRVSTYLICRQSTAKVRP
jgi:hypothetical protein